MYKIYIFEIALPATILLKNSVKLEVRHLS